MSGAKLLDSWSPPDGAGSPVACLATTFTLEADFFTQDCLSRFLSLSMITGEGDAISSIAALLEEEERLSEAQVSVLVDRSSPAETRNLRWDLLPIHVPDGLLHAKVAVLLWERSARIILGSANLTTAGYRRQIELALTIDIDERCEVPKPVLEDLVIELRHVVGLAPGAVSGAKARALATIDNLAVRIEGLKRRSTGGHDVRLAVAPARPGVSPLDRLATVWRGVQPLRATVLSPFWDDQVPAPAVEAVQHCLTGRPASRRSITLVTGIDPYTGALQAPPSLVSQAADVVAFNPPDLEPRTLHAKLLLFESDDWLAALIGSSNATRAGLGLDPLRGHHELNLWLGCPAKSRAAKQLRSLARAGDHVSLDDERWVPVADEDEVTVPMLPLGFVMCTLDVTSRQVLLEFQPKSLPTSWRVRTPAGYEILTSRAWLEAGAPRSMTRELPDAPLPSYLMICWDVDEEPQCATWTANVKDPSALPPPEELTDLPLEVLLATLGSTRPLPQAFESELRRRARRSKASERNQLDPLDRFDDSGLLLQRARNLSLALWRLQERLGRPTTSLDALDWRLNGAIGPMAIANGLVSEVRDQQTLPGEAHFLLAELALTVAAVDWRQVVTGADLKRVRRLFADVLVSIGQLREELPPAPEATLEAYVGDALKKAAQL